MVGMNSDYEKLRNEQLQFLDNWNQSFVIPNRKEKGHNNFSLNYGEIYALRVDDLVSFAKQNKMSFEFSDFMDEIVFKDHRKNKGWYNG